ncbi:MAG TPA: FecR domain-containing protein [Roseateles sp.]
MPREILAEAAVWVARLHGPDRSRDMERECLAWQAQSEAHRQAFERCTDTWLEAAGLTRAQVQAAIGGPRRRASSWGNTGRMALAVAVLSIVVIATLILWPGQTYSTGVGEQRLIILTDGSRMTLNTSTEVRVWLTDSQRNVTVKYGEALFEVAKEAGRPFVVVVADAQVVATGTAFLVRSTPPAQSASDAFGVTLIEGQVIVQRAAATVQSTLNAPVVMAPGERLSVNRLAGSSGQAPKRARVDRPQLDQLLAWQRGFAVLDDTTLNDAVADMNRYSKVSITLRDPQALGALRVSGTFRTGDNEAFAQAVARLHGLVVIPRGGGLELASK